MVTECDGCHGKGVKLIVRQLGPSMIQQMQTQCSDCDGKGEIIPPGGRCRKCHGNKVIPEAKSLEINVIRGMRVGEKIVFHGEGDQKPGIIPGNVIVVLKQERHPLFRRDGRHLFYKKTLSIKEALCGFKFEITHLDDRRLLIVSNPGQLYTHGVTKRIPDEGFQSTDGRGNLYIELEVEFKKADFFTEEQKKYLRDRLPKIASLNIDRSDEMVEEVSLIEVDLEEEKKKFERRRSKNQYDEDDDEPAQGRSCQTQ